MSFRSIKNDMMIENGLVYLNHASVGPLPVKSKNIFENGILVQALVGEKKIDYESIETLWNNLRTNVAKLVNGEKEGVTITTNTASGLHIIADGLQSQYKFGKQNIVIPDIEFVTNSFCWQELAKRYALELRTVSSRENRIDLKNYEKIIDDNTILVVLSHVQFSNGFRSNLKEISRIAHEHGSFVSVDAIQSLGIVPFNVKEFDVDFVSAAGYKWLLGPYGTGVFYTKPEHIELLDSILVGWFSTPHYKELAHQEFKPWKDARKFQQTMINPAMDALNASLETVLKWDVKKSYEHVISLLDILIEELSQFVNFSIGSSLQSNERSGIVKINSPNDLQSAVTYLGTKNITVSYRDKGIRVSPHAYNTKEDIMALVNELKAWSLS